MSNLLVKHEQDTQLIDASQGWKENYIAYHMLKVIQSLPIKIMNMIIGFLQQEIKVFNQAMEYISINQT